MASVTSLDKDLRRLRLEKYTPAAADEARRWIEEALGEKLASPDLLEGLRDGVALCRLVNLAVPAPGIRFKKSAMPFVQMENISQFISACQAPPLSLLPHDTFLTVDLFEQKDPAQVLQCIGAFSRVAHAADPRRFPDPIGPKTRPAGLTPQPSGGAERARTRGASFASDASSGYGGGGARSTASQDSASWGRRDKEAAVPAWNVAQYGYTGGASQGSLGISFGSRRQVISAGPTVPSLAEKERARRDKVAEEERARHEEEERRREVLRAEERQLQQQEEDARLEAKASRLREQERAKSEHERRQWEEQERRWKLAEEERRREEHEAAARIEEERLRNRPRGTGAGTGTPKLHGQFLSQYQAEQAAAAAAADAEAGSRELEAELELARQREAEYERDRQGRSSAAGPAFETSAKPEGTSTSRSRPMSPRSPSSNNNTSQLSRHESWSQGGEVLHTKWHQRQQDLPEEPRPLPDPRALPQNNNRGPPKTTQTLLQREMELERQRQREWEQAQAETAARTPEPRDGRWDVSQWSGYTGGDNQNRGAQGIGAGRRQVVGPRPLPNPTDPSP